MRQDLLVEAKKHKAWKLLRHIPGIGPIRAAILIAVMQTPHRFRTNRQLWTYSGLGLETHDSGQYYVAEGQLHRSKKPPTVRGLSKDHNHDLKDIFKGAATRVSSSGGPLRDFYENLLAKGRKPTMARLRPRTELRHPPAPQSDCKEGMHCIGGGVGGGSVADGAPDQRDPHALGIYLLRVTPTELNPAEPFQVEFKVLNTGTAPIELPVSPHLSDLQPNDESEAFSYFSLALVVRGEGETQRPDVVCMGFVQLYGSPEHAERMIMLRPGEWIRVSASVLLRTWPSQPVSTRFRGDFWLQRNIFHPHPGGQFIEAQNLYPNTTRTPYVAVRLLPLPGSETPKQ